MFHRLHTQYLLQSKFCFREAKDVPEISCGTRCFCSKGFVCTRNGKHLESFRKNISLFADTSTRKLEKAALLMTHREKLDDDVKVERLLAIQSVFRDRERSVKLLQRDHIYLCLT